MVMDREKLERRAWLKGLWEIVKEIFCQKLLTLHLPSPPLFLPNYFSDLTVIVTGATSGIGLETARELAMAGAHVIMACRDVGAAGELARAWREEARGRDPPRVEAMPLDLVSLASVRLFAAEWEKREEPLHILVNNAGVFLTKAPQMFSNDGIDQHMQVNHIAPALLTLLLLPSLLRAPSSRIINVNSVSHHCALVDPRHWKTPVEDDRYNGIRSYGESKLAHLMFLKTMARELREERVTSVQCIAVNPGIVHTKLAIQVPIPDWMLFWMLDPAQGARSVLFCATSSTVVDSLDDTGFAYFSCACRPAKVSPEAKDEGACTEVWQRTLKILDLDVEYVAQVVECGKTGMVKYCDQPSMVNVDPRKWHFELGTMDESSDHSNALGDSIKESSDSD